MNRLYQLTEVTIQPKQQQKISKPDQTKSKLHEIAHTPSLCNDEDMARDLD